MGIDGAQYETLLAEQLDHVARVTINRPEKLNAISRLVQRELIDAVESSADDPDVHVVVIRGAGPSFCAGYDITPSNDRPADTRTVPGQGFRSLSLARGWSRIWNAPVPVVAQIHGHCLAGGTDLAQHCDLVVVAEDAVIGFPALRMGGTPPTNMWLYNIGPQWTKRLLLTGDTFTGRFAPRIGFALEAVPGDNLDDHVLALASRIAAVDRDVTAINKFVVNAGIELMGRSALQDIAAPMDAIANEAPVHAAFAERAREIGLAAAFKERDAPFRDGVPLDTIDGG